MGVRMNLFTRTFLVLLSVGAMSVGLADSDDGFDAKDSQLVRVMRNDDGSRTVFKRIPGQRLMNKIAYDPNGVIKALTIYKTDIYGNLRSCKILDGKKNELFKVAYGYDKFGRLVAENMYDSKTSKLVSIYEYTYGADGKRSKPICYVKAAIDAAKKMHALPSAWEKNPFDDSNDPKGTPLKDK